MQELKDHTDTMGAGIGETPAPEGPESSTRRMTLNMGPQHPSTHGVLRVVLELDGETILKRGSRHRLLSHRHRKGMRGKDLAAGGYADRSR